MVRIEKAGVEGQTGGERHVRVAEQRGFLEKIPPWNESDFSRSVTNESSSGTTMYKTENSGIIRIEGMR
jgi:hypothetical protein